LDQTCSKIPFKYIWKLKYRTLSEAGVIIAQISKPGVKNQRGENSMPPNISTVILPSRENGPVVYTEPITQLVEEVKKARPLNELII